MRILKGSEKKRDYYVKKFKLNKIYLIFNNKVFVLGIDKIINSKFWIYVISEIVIWGEEGGWLREREIERYINYVWKSKLF